MAAHLTGSGFQVLRDRPVLRLDDRDGDAVLDALRMCRYGSDAVGVVRVGEVGEIFFRAPDASEIHGPLWQPAPNVEEAWRTSTKTAVVTSW